MPPGETCEEGRSGTRFVFGRGQASVVGCNDTVLVRRSLSEEVWTQCVLRHRAKSSGPKTAQRTFATVEVYVSRHVVSSS